MTSCSRKGACPFESKRAESRSQAALESDLANGHSLESSSRRVDKLLSTFDFFESHSQVDTYVPRIKKSKKRKSGAGTDELYSSKWPYFRALQFLIPFLTPSETISNLNKETNCKNDVPTTVTTENTSESLKTVEIIKKSDPKGKQKKRRAEADDEDSLKAALKILKREPDEHDIFGEYVAQELRSLKFDFNKRKLKSEIRKAIVRIADDDDSLSQPSTSFQYSKTNDDSTSSVSGQLNFSNVNLSGGQSNKTSGEYITHVEFEKFKKNNFILKLCILFI
ncbi:uncharacterized protein LOC129948232 [Eupeodes corollae]|uniref:uncharacterized protein LOC129948232 n=1 Tax=Eupeodes corollae TaxID=290404 RepID=UPI00248FDCAD|nr:uncharacterized protein LOC129948232 [Eupeodes corollae]